MCKKLNSISGPSCYPDSAAEKELFIHEPCCHNAHRSSTYLLKDFCFPITVTTALTAQSGSSYVPQIRDIAVEGISQNPIFHPRPLTFAIFPFPSYILHLFFWTRGSKDHGQLRT